MHETDQQQQGLVIHQGQTKLIQIGNQFYQLSEIQAQPLAVNPQPVAQPVVQSASPPVPHQSQPTPIYPTALPQQESIWNSAPMVILLGTGVLLLAGFGTFVVVRAALPPAPVAVPPAPAAAPPPPTPVIIQQAPPPPPPMPYKRTNCKPAGIFGGEVCSTEEGFIR